jgi:hypothetical protein
MEKIARALRKAARRLEGKEVGDYANSTLRELAFSGEDKNLGDIRKGDVSVPDLYWISREIREDDLREKALRNARGLFVVSVLLTFSIIFLQGWEVWGFHLPVSFLNWLGAATIGEIGGLLLLGYRYLF